MREVHVVTIPMPRQVTRLHVHAFADVGPVETTVYVDATLLGRARTAAIDSMLSRLAAQQQATARCSSERRRRPVDVPRPGRQAHP